VDQHAYPEELPQHRVELDAFWIGKYPVTNRQYQAFVRAAGQRPPDHWKKGVIPTGKEQHPVVYVNWEDAAAFCRWAAGLPGGQGVRLPSEAEWEKAARGTDGRIYPWGNTEPDAFLCNFDLNLGDTTPVGEYSPGGDSPYGCADMAGNVCEWVADRYGAKYYESSPKSNPTGPSSSDSRVLRGGFWDSGSRYLRLSYRLWNYPEVCYYSNGFRCAR
jgi:eukaryotic-like serine/threonine-protein kinase